MSVDTTVIIEGVPPNFEEIVKVFPEAASRRVVFSYGDVVYSPGGPGLSAPLRAHEAVHGSRQLAMGVELWWRRYLEDAQFRLHEEIPAHQAEYREYCRTHFDRNSRVKELHHIAAKLAGPLYGKIITSGMARAAILK